MSRLGETSARVRDSARARLALRGPAAVEALAAALPEAGPASRLEILSCLEGLGDARAVPAVLPLLSGDRPEVVSRAAATLGTLGDASVVPALAGTASRDDAAGTAAVEALVTLHRRGTVEALDPLLGVLLDPARSRALRQAASAVLADLPERERAPLRERLDALPPLLAAPATPWAADAATLARRLLDCPEDEAEPLRQRLASLGATGAAAMVEALEATAPDAGRSHRAADALAAAATAAREPLERALRSTSRPDVLRVLAEALARLRLPAAIPHLHAALGRIWAAGGDGPHPTAEAAARLHLALAALGSRVALYHLREMLEARPPPAPLLLLAAAAEVGDASLVLPVALLATEHPELLDPCAAAFAAIARREGLRRGRGRLRRVPEAHRAALDAFWRRARAGS